MLKKLFDWTGHRNFFISCALATVMSAGGWVTTFLIPPDQLTASDYDEARRFGHGAVAMVGEEWMYQVGFDVSLQSRLWETRREVQSIVAKCFWVSLGLLALSYWIRPENIPRSLNVFSSVKTK